MTRALQWKEPGSGGTGGWHRAGEEGSGGGGGAQRSGQGPELQGQGEGLGGFHDSGLGAAPRYQEGFPRRSLSMADPPRAHWQRRQDEARGCRGRLTGGPAAAPETGRRASPEDSKGQSETELEGASHCRHS